MRFFSNFETLGSKFLIKIGISFILIGLLILLLKEIIILILASIFIAIGLFLLSLSYRIWNINRLN